MWLWYDWQAAAVVDEHGHLVDVMQWDGHMTEHAVVERLRLIASGQPIREARELHDRFPEAKLCVHGDPQLPDAEWPLPSAEQQTIADAACTVLCCTDARPQHLYARTAHCACRRAGEAAR